MASIKQKKKIENEIHEQLYNNVFLLSQIYPSTKEFNRVFKKDMFVKNNKAAFHEVVYYLLQIINPEQTKQVLISWPPFGIKKEQTFRCEVVKYVEGLNVQHESANIPHITSSHLVSPGGFKFARFMLMLSQLAVYEHLKRSEDIDVLHYPKPNKNMDLNKVSLTNLKKKTDAVENKSKEVIKNFEVYHSQLNEKALLLVEELTDLDNKINEAKKLNKSTKEEFTKKFSELGGIEEKVKTVKIQWESLKEIYNLFTTCDNFLSYLSSDETVLEHKNEINVPNELAYTLNNKNGINLTEYFSCVNSLLESISLELPNPTESFIIQQTEKLKKLTITYSDIHKKFSEGIEDFQKVLEKLTEDLNLIVDLISPIGSDSEDPLCEAALNDSTLNFSD